MPMLTLGLAALGFLYPFAAMQIWDAHRYRDHPTESVRRELRNWALVLVPWTVAVSLVAWSAGVAL